MKNKLTSLIFFLLLFSLVNAQNDKKPTRYMVMQDVVPFNKTMEYESAQKEINNFFASNKLDFKWRVYKSDDNIYMYLIPFSDYADLDKIFKAWDEKIKTVNQDEFNKKWNAFNGTIDHTNNIIIQLSESSYTPKNSYITADKSSFTHWDFFEVIPGKEKEAWALMKDYKSTCEKENTEVPFHVWSVNFGERTSTIVITTPANSDIDFYTHNKAADDKIMKSPGAMELYGKFMACIKKFNHFNGKPRPDLSLN